MGICHVSVGRGRGGRGGAFPGFVPAVSYDVQSGKLLWVLGDREDPDMFCLGPPLPLGGQLYAMAEIKDEIRRSSQGVI